MFPQLEKYKNKGHFFFRKECRLIDLTRNIPNLPGVYYIVKLAAGKIEIVYIGKAGTMESDGAFKKQGLQKRLNMKQDGLFRQEFFETKLLEESIDALDIYWFVTFDEYHQDVPAFLEASMLQDFYWMYDKLPSWNKTF